MGLIYKTICLLSALIGASQAGISCDFETDFCDWYQIKSDHLDWKLGTSGTPDRTSGPEHDHTTGQGNFAYLSGSHARLNNASGGMITPLVVTNETATLSFWYHMNGNGIGSLLVLIIDVNGNRQEITRITGRQGNEWRKTSFDLPSGSFRICILGTARYHFGSDIGIDDIILLGHVQEITTTPPPTTPEPTIDVSELKCDFELDFCQWKQDAEDQFDWRRTAFDTPDRSSGPIADHTTGNGSYAFISGHEVMQTYWISRMISPEVVVYKRTTFKFWYHMNGHGIGSLIIKSLLNTGKTNLLFKVTGRQGPDWNEGRIDLLPGIYRLSIEATVRLHYGSDIAIDDITVVPL
ncbi:hypothetical protein LOTGIDRAFT_228113 [Lottia gigantea]|uniref:MAM domain-containing protein n=1 Tax=Lottia gigantea TaxID=225164 RepID=V4BCX6_LOTGI|nr:hypothetical protein LOTGIDRAFT_228113 [Lottia gigantea]ESP05606.1 hypothetical protein LOTGIDRAFT_228113 [Lottia gigantea]